jgi:polyhydroxyalkanoate synthesis regulator phasin
MTNDANPAPISTAPAPPIFSLDLGSNGGVFAPTNAQEMYVGINRERNFWAWLDPIPGPSHRGAIDYCRAPVTDAAGLAQQAIQYELSSPDNFRETVTRIQGLLNSAFKDRGLPHSSTPVARRIEQIRQRDPLEAQAYLFAYISPNGHVFDGREISSWRGLIEGVNERFGLLAGTEDLHQATLQSINDVLAKTGQLLAQKSAAYDDLHRRFEALEKQIAEVEQKQKSDFTSFIETNQHAHDEVVRKHENDMASLQKVFREEMTLRAPVDYSEKRNNHHARRTAVLGAVSFGSMAVLAIALGVIAQWVLSNLTADGKPEAWRVAVIGLVGVLGGGPYASSCECF